MVPFSSTINTDASDQGDAAWHKKAYLERWKPGNFKAFRTGRPYGIVMHHTVRRYDLEDVTNKSHYQEGDTAEEYHAKRWARTGKGIHYMIGRNGQIYKLQPDEYKGVHVGGGKNKKKLTQFAKDNDLTNFTTQAVELIARDDEDVTPEQIEAATRLAKLLGYKSNQVFGHPELKKGQNPPTYREGMSAVDRIRGTSLTPVSPRTSTTQDQTE